VLIRRARAVHRHTQKVEAAGFSEVILYFNVGLKPHTQVKEEMDRFMREVAPAFEGGHKRPRGVRVALRWQSVPLSSSLSLYCHHLTDTEQVVLFLGEANDRGVNYHE